MNGYQLLSELFALLGRVDGEALAEARAATDSAKVRAVLDAMRRARNLSEKETAAVHAGPSAVAEPRHEFPARAEMSWGAGHARNTGPDGHRPAEATAASEHAPPEPLNGVGAAAEAASLSRLLRNVRLRNDEIVVGLRRAGLKVVLKAKEPRARLLSRVEKALAQLPVTEQRSVVRELRRQLHIDETGGWIDAIRSERKG